MKSLSWSGTDLFSVTAISCLHDFDIVHGIVERNIYIVVRRMAPKGGFYRVIKLMRVVRGSERRQPTPFSTSASSNLGFVTFFNFMPFHTVVTLYELLRTYEKKTGRNFLFRAFLGRYCDIMCVISTFCEFGNNLPHLIGVGARVYFCSELTSYCCWRLGIQFSSIFVALLTQT